MTDELPEFRKKPPYVMYDMLKDSYNGVVATLEKMNSFDYSKLEGPIYFTGNGTAYHSAIIGAQILASTDKEWHAIQAFELEKYSNPHGTVIGVSHTGKTKSTIDALLKVGNSNRTIGITHYEKSPITAATDYSIVIGNSPDESLCNTKAFFDNVFSILRIACSYGGIDIDLRALSLKVKEAIEGLDQQVRDIAGELSGVTKIFVLGAGPDLAVAREAAQKLKEATHVHTEGIELEEFNHGCTSVIDEKTIVVIIETEKVRERAQDIVKACREVGTLTLVVNGSGSYSVHTPVEQNEFLSPVLHVVPLYLLAYHLAVAKGINPDYLRFEDKRYLKYDNIVFPPGAH